MNVARGKYVSKYYLRSDKNEAQLDKYKNMISHFYRTRKKKNLSRDYIDDEKDHKNVHLMQRILHIGKEKRRKLRTLTW